MKKLISLLFLTFLFSGSVHADSNIVFYCSDDLVTGMEGEYKSIDKYKPSRFNAKVDTLNLTKIIVDGEEYQKTGYNVLNIYIDKTGSMIRFYSFKGNKIQYHRSIIFGMSDSIYVANGTCEKF